jgi:aminoglycoside phosphotransferase family enzyme
MKMELKQEDIIDNLKKEYSYPHPVSSVKVIETHISWILLTGRQAYKVKKAVKFGNILDFSKLYLRKKFCEEEVLLNRPLCGNMYQGIVKVVRCNGQFRIVNISHEGKGLEYAVKMLEIPQEYRMDRLLRTNKVTSRTIRSLTTHLVRFHRTAKTNAKISKFGSPTFMKWKIRENFKTLSDLTNLDISQITKLNVFVRNNKEFLSYRMKYGKIREIHGDLYLRNIFLSKGKFYFYDRIEFNASLRYADIAEDVAHLAMDLDYHKREDLRKYLIYYYVKKSGDSTLTNVIYFIMCYKSLVRAKVSLFRRKQIISKKSGINRRNISGCELEARKLFALARKYMEMF